MKKYRKGTWLFQSTLYFLNFYFFRISKHWHQNPSCAIIPTSTNWRWWPASADRRWSLTTSPSWTAQPRDSADEEPELMLVRKPVIYLYPSSSPLSVAVELLLKSTSRVFRQCIPRSRAPSRSVNVKPHNHNPASHLSTRLLAQRCLTCTGNRRRLPLTPFCYSDRDWPPHTEAHNSFITYAFSLSPIPQVSPWCSSPLHCFFFSQNSVLGPGFVRYWLPDLLKH